MPKASQYIPVYELKKYESDPYAIPDFIRWYLKNGPLVVPDTSYTKVLCHIVLFVLLNVALSLTLIPVVKSHSNALPIWIVRVMAESPKLFCVLFSVTELLLACMCVAKQAVIGLLRLYQRYAPEELRRRCRFKPTCSEYAILAIEKFGVIIGLCMVYDRSFHRCRGSVMLVDYP